MRAALNRLGRVDLSSLICQTPACLAEESSLRQKAINEYESSATLYAPTVSYPGEREASEKIKANYESYRGISDRGAALLSAGKTGDALDLLASDSTASVFTDATNAIGADLDLNVEVLLTQCQRMPPQTRVFTRYLD